MSQSLEALGDVVRRCRENATDPQNAELVARIEADTARRAAIDRRDRIARLRLQIPPMFANASLLDIDITKHNEAAIEAARAVVDNGFVGGLGIMGRGTGVGKSHIAVGIANAAIAANVAARFLTVVTFFERMHEASKFSSDDDVTVAIREFASTPVLVLDDLGREPITRRTLPWLYELLNRRWLERRHIVLTTNLTYEQLLRKYVEGARRAEEDETVAAAIVDRLADLAPLPWIEVTGQSYRGRR